MANTLYYREITEVDICPDCKGILTHGVFREKDRTVWSVCFTCGYNFETFGWPSKRANDKKGKQFGKGKDGVK